MPELPEVEHFRRMLCPLKNNDKQPIQLELIKCKNPPKKDFITQEQVQHVNDNNMYVSQVLRRGKQICIVLVSASTDGEKQDEAEGTKKEMFLYVHMGMTGRITTPTRAPSFGHYSNNEAKPPDVYPPPYTYLRFRSGKDEACFSDPRKFGNIYLGDTIKNHQFMSSLAPDGLDDSFKIESAMNLSMGIKAVLLDQKRVVCGVGNWVADEVLYQTQIHPDQNYLTIEQATKIQHTLKEILSTAVDCLDAGTNYPSHWIFHYRWSKGKKNSGNGGSAVKDAQGRNIQFITSGGRTSAIVPSIQKNISQQKPQSLKKNNNKKTKNSRGTKPPPPTKKNTNTDSDVLGGTNSPAAPVVVSPEADTKSTGKKRKKVQDSTTTANADAATNKSRKKQPSDQDSLSINTSSRRRSPRLIQPLGS